MRYNKNIILEILQSYFDAEIESFIDCYVTDMKAYELTGRFEQLAEYAELDSISEMEVLDFQVEKDIENDEEIIDGILFVLASIDGNTYWDGGHFFLGSEEVGFEFHFSFLARQNEYYSFEMY